MARAIVMLVLATGVALGQCTPAKLPAETGRPVNVLAVTPKGLTVSGQCGVFQVRLFGVQTPLNTQAVERMIAGQAVRLEQPGERQDPDVDQDGLLADVYILMGGNTEARLNYRIIWTGEGQHDPSHHSRSKARIYQYNGELIISRDLTLAEAETLARSAKRGRWKE